MKYILLLCLFVLGITATLIKASDKPIKKSLTIQYVLKNQSEFKAIESELGVTFVSDKNGQSLFLAFNPSGCEKATDCGDTWWDATCGCQCRWCVIHAANGSFICKKCDPCPYC